MKDVLIVFLSLSVSGSIIALILLVLKPFVKNKLSQTWQYYIWLIVILRFLLPFTPQVSVVGELSRFLQDISNPPGMVQVDPGIGMNEEYTSPQAPDDSQTSQASDIPQISTAPQNTETPELFIYWHDILNNIWLLWIGVALVLFTHKLAGYRSFVRFINAGRKKITDTNILDIYNDELTAAKVKKQLPLYMNNQVISPMLVGIVRPLLVIPVLEVNSEELRQIFRHELTHYKRLDILYKWIVQITLCLHWFNPLVYLINRQINKSCELSCDETVIKHLNEDERIIYGDALMASLEAQGNYSDFVVSITMSENVNLVKERLDKIMDYKKKSKITSCVAILLTTLLLCSATFTGAYAASNSSKPNIHSEYDPYLPFGITVSSDVNSKDVLYFSGQRVRLLLDQRKDKSFNLFYSDEEGTIDLYVKRNNKDRMTGIKKLDEDTAKEFLDELGFTGNLAYPYRLTMSELPVDLQDWIEESNQSKGIFIVQFYNRYYVYCNSIPGEFAWQPHIDTNTTLEIYDLNKSRKGDGYALLSLPPCDNLTVTYKNISVSITKETVKKIVREQQTVFDKSTAYKIENGKVTVPFSISKIAEGTERYGKEHYGYVCLGQIPNINNAKRIIYAVDADSGSGLFIAMSTDDKSVTHQYNWYNFHVTPEKNFNTTLEELKGKIGKDTNYNGNYYLYVGTTKTTLTNITGTITVEY